MLTVIPYYVEISTKYTIMVSYPDQSDGKPVPNLKQTRVVIKMQSKQLGKKEGKFEAWKANGEKL